MSVGLAFAKCLHAVCVKWKMKGVKDWTDSEAAQSEKPVMFKLYGPTIINFFHRLMWWLQKCSKFHTVEIAWRHDTPDWQPSKIQEGPVWELCQAMAGWTQATFNAFKKHIRLTANTLELDEYCGPQDQDQSKWEKLLDACLREFPELNDFYDHWPLDIYYRKLVYFRVVQRRRRDKEASATAALNNAQPTTVNSKKRKAPYPQPRDEGGEGNIGSTRSVAARSIQPPQNQLQRLSQPQAKSSRFGSGSSLAVTNDLISSPNVPVAGNRPGAESSSLAGNSIPSVRTTSNASIGNKHSTGSLSSANQTTSNPSVLSSTSLSSSPPNSSLCGQPATKFQGRSQQSFCVLCGFHPPVHDSEITQLNLDRHLLARLVNAGVVADHHLRALLRLSESRQEACLHALASAEKFTWVEKVEIAEALETYVDKNPDFTQSSQSEPARKARLTAISRPRKGLENVLAVHTCKYKWLKEHLQITDDAEHFELVDFVESRAPWYLDTSRPIEEQDPEQLDALVTAVCKEKPSVRRYDACWVVHLHIRRFLDARAAGLLCTPRDAAGPDMTPTAPLQEHECHGLTMYPPSSVPPTIATLLADYGMEELGPAFVSLGFTSDAKFDKIVASHWAKENFIDKLPARVLKCSAFQFFMLKYIIESA
ncbi:hypothetical protein C8R45DRAFT_1151679 [Mycena sanguinolenta]|nr:hypothetical protein C8R45DRAFT_1151679 [Mycena sanguinolenta]